MPEGIQTFLNHSLSIDKLELILVDIPQRTTFRSAIGLRKSRQAILLRWTDKNGQQGYGECSCRPDPYYSSEFLEGVALVIERFLFPMACQSETYGGLVQAMQQVRGWPFAKAALEMAAHDLLFHKHGKSIFDHWRILAKPHIPVGISIGLQEDLHQLEKTVSDALADHYHRLKFKIHPGFDPAQTQLLDAYREQLIISFDANGSFQKNDIDELKQFVPFGSALEQPFPPHRIDYCQAAKDKFPDLKICLDEEVKSLGQMIQAHQLGAVDELNIKPGRVGGLVSSIALADYCYEHDIPCWVGGMFESGIGRSINLQFAARLDAPAHDLSPSGRYFERDVLAVPLQMDKKGCIALSDAENAEVDPAVIDTFTTNRKELINR